MKEKNKQEVVVEETPKFEQLPYNKRDRYIPTEFQIINYRNSWKKCYCGRQTWMNDNYCPGCGQRLGIPTMN